MHERYIEQVRLLMRALPSIAEEKVFALKGGSAINLFYRDMPRLSVDIDLVYLPVEDRETSLRNIDEALDRIVGTLARRSPDMRLQRIAGGGNNETRIMIGSGRAQVKVETSPVGRGIVLAPQSLRVADVVKDTFGFAEMQVVAFEDLYGGKLHAALDRQHPRDFYDVKLLYENEGLTDSLFRVFLVYVSASGRPMHELLAPAKASLDALYTEEFAGMTRDVVSLDELESARARLLDDIRTRLTGDAATFLLSLHDAEPDFGLIGLPDAERLPAAQWKLLNLRKLKADNPKKHAEQRALLKALLG
ncbi:MAG: nucleotidyl transferase AbiEii/AbiGii toxin family protein [Hyphomicrobiales bacterium]|nr:nucleotidyl transferase AbiEii/AbiGii toxin family protein [Hyphomicrobiales bacterium]